MLTLRQLDDAPTSIIKIVTDAEVKIIKDMANNISKLGYVDANVSWQMERLLILGKQKDFIIKELNKTLKLSEEQLIYLFDEGATRALKTDEKIYMEAGLNPTPFSENKYMQMIVVLGALNSREELKNTIRNTVNKTMNNFEKVLDNSYASLFLKGQSYQQVIIKALKDISAKGLLTFTYPNGRTENLYSAVRRLVLTGISQTVANLQLNQMQEMGVRLVEVTAHAGARPTHAKWQGKVFQTIGNSPYPNFYESTGYGTGAGLCGWNCRHSFYPYFESLSNRTYDSKMLSDYNNRTVVYNGEKISLYDATQYQRHIERKIREWKYGKAALEGAKLNTSKAVVKVRHWQTVQRDFISQTGLKRDYFRERTVA